MKIKNIRITLKDKKEVLKTFGETLRKARKGESMQRHEEVSFENIETLRKILTEKRLELLHIIKEKKRGPLLGILARIKMGLEIALIGWRLYVVHRISRLARETSPSPSPLRRRGN